MSFTEQQAQAVMTLNQNLAVIAGAGSGKTHVLVSRFLHILDENPTWPLNAVVAITFTKKAAAEMRDRVRAGLEARYFRTLADNGNYQRWQDLIAQMDSARITTIHGLCVEILRTNAARIGLDPGFAVAEEVAANILLTDTIDAVLNEISGTDDDTFTPLLAAYNLLVMRDTLRQSTLSGLTITPITGDALFSAWQADYRRETRLFYEKIRMEAEEILPPHEDTEDKLLPFWHGFEETLDIILTSDEPLIGLQTMALLTKPGTKGSKSHWGDEDTLKTARSLIVRAIDYAKINAFVPEYERTLAHLTGLWTALMQRVREAYQTAKRRNNVLDFDDLERLTCDILQDKNVVVRYRMAEIQHLMVDEFQDTNANQWQIVKALADIERGGTMFVVGDPKQSIYAFRGADVSVFGGVCAEISTSGAGNQIPLAQSFRTHQPLVQTFNVLFGKLLVRDEASPVKDFQVTLGEPMDAQREHPPNNDPCMEFILIPKPEEAKTADIRRTWEAHEIAGRIHELVRAGRPIYDRATQQIRPADYGDFAILFRALTSITLYEDVFKAQGLPYLTLSGRGYYDTPEIWDLRNALQAIYNPMDNLALAAALRSPLFTVSDEALFALRFPLPDSSLPGLWERLQATAHDTPPPYLPVEQMLRLRFAWTVLQNLQGIAGRVTIAELLQALLAQTGYMAILTALPDGNQRRANVEKLIDKAQMSGRATLGAFLQYLDEMKTAEVREGEAATLSAGSVSIMTVHASKGLEFPVVVLADTSYGGRGQTDAVVLDSVYGVGCQLTLTEEPDKYRGFNHQRISQRQKAKDDAENLRLLYVAATRAQDLLIISGQAHEDKKTGEIVGGGGWLKTILAEFKIPDTLDGEDNVMLFGASVPPVRVWMPDSSPAYTDARTALAFTWPSADVDPIPPPLVRTHKVERLQQIRQLAATHIADVGSAESTKHEEAVFYRQRFRRQVLHDAPNYVETVSDGRDQHVRANQIGKIVHEALRHWHLPKRTPTAQLDRILTAYAWRFGLTDEAQIQQAVMQAKGLLYKFEDSPTFDSINMATQVYREMPFMYRVEDTIINGVIDVVYRDEADNWHIADYKTSFVPNKNYTEHARRYHLQLGVYALALEAQLNRVPKTTIHYIRYTHTVTIAESDWRKAVNARGLKARIQSMLLDEGDNQHE